MSRWKYLAPRLCLLTILLAVGWFLRTPISSWFLQRTLTPMGVDAQVDDIEISLWNSTVRLQKANLRLSDSPNDSIYLADGEFKLDRSLMLRRQITITHGTVEGLDIHADQSPAIATAENIDKLAENDLVLRRWFHDCSARLNLEPLEFSESAALYRKQLRYWESRYSSSHERIASIKDRLNTLESRANELDDRNILRNHDLLEQANNEINSLYDELAQLPSEFQQLQEDVLDDREQFETAKQNDIAKLRQLATLSQLSPDTLARYLFAPQEQKRVLEAIGWANWARQVLPPTGGETEPAVARGEAVQFSRIQQRPNLSIEKLHVSGSLDWQKQRVPIQGIVRNLTDAPHLLNRPVLVDLESTGSIPLAIHANLDRTGATPHDQVVIRITGIQVPETVIGDANELAVRIPAGSANLVTKLDIRGDQVKGTISMVRTDLQLATQVSGDLDQFGIQEDLQAAIERVKVLHVDVLLDGTLSEPNWRIKSDLAEQVYSNLNASLQRRMDQRFHELVPFAESECEQHWQALIAASEKHSASLTAAINGTNRKFITVSLNFDRRFGLGSPVRTAIRPADVILR